MHLVEAKGGSYATRYLGRPISCVRCGLVWDVIDFPVGYVNAATYVCPDHFAPVLRTNGQFDASDFAPSIEVGKQEERHLRVVT